MDEPVDGRFEQAGRGRQKDRQTLVIGADFLGELVIAIGRRGIDGYVAEPVEEGGDTAAAVVGEIFLQRGARPVAIFARGHFRAGGADDFEVRLEQAVGIQRAERGQQHALREVSGRAEEQQAVGVHTHARGQAIIGWSLLVDAVTSANSCTPAACIPILSSR